MHRETAAPLKYNFNFLPPPCDRHEQAGRPPVGRSLALCRQQPFARSVFQDHIDGMNDAGNISEKGQQDIDPELDTKTDLEKDAQGRDQDG